MHKRTSPKVFGHAKQLHRKMTPAEVKLWSRLRAHQLNDVHFRNHTCPGGRCQGHAIGNYIVDFCAPRKKLIIELDGSQHLDQQEYDAERTHYLESCGYTVIRFWNHQVMNDLGGVICALCAILQAMDADKEKP